MQTITPIRITKQNFETFGRYYDLQDCEHAAKLETQEFMSWDKISDEPLKIGTTSVKGGPFLSQSMERHMLSEEVLLCGDDDMILTVADSDPKEAPQSKDVKAFILKPGDVVVLKMGVWHDANHGVHKDTTYFFLIPQRKFAASEVEWIAIKPESVSVVWEQEKENRVMKAVPADCKEFEPFGNYIKVMDGQGFLGEAGWRSWLENETGLETGGHLGICSVEYSSEFSEMECNTQEKRQIICACDSMVIAVMEDENELDMRAFILQMGDYVVLKEHVCFKVLGVQVQSGQMQSGHYYTLSPHNHRTRCVSLRLGSVKLVSQDRDS